MLRAQIVEKCYSKQLRERLLAQEELDLVKVTLYDENTDFIIFYIFIDLYSGAGDLSIAASFFQKY
jgi:hypothetical protein